MRSVGARRTIAVLLIVVAASAVAAAWRSCGAGGSVTPVAPEDALLAGEEPSPRQPPRVRQGTPSGPAAAVAETATPAAPEAAVQRVEVLVLDSIGKPAAGAEVTFTDAHGDEVLGAVATTDAEGRATLAQPPRRRDIRLRAARGDAVVFGVVRDEPVSGETLRLAAGVVIAGHVMDPGGTPIEGARVSANVAALDVHPHYRAAVTDAGGAFTLPALPSASLGDGVYLRPYAAGWSGVRRHVDAEAARRSVELVLSPTRRVQGRCVSETGNPVPKVHVAVREGRWWVETIDDGRFDLEFDAADVVAVTGVPKEHAAFGRIVHVAPEGAMDLGDIVLRAGGTVSGRVVDESGTPLPHASVKLVSKEFGEVRWGDTDEEGAYVLPAVGDGAFLLEAEAWPTESMPRHGRVDGVRAGDANVHVAVAPGRAVRLRPVAYEDGRPLDVSRYAMRVRRSDAPGIDVISTQVSGPPVTTACVRVPRPGRYDIAFAVPGRQSATLLAIDVKDDVIETIDVVLRRP